MEVTNNNKKAVISDDDDKPQQENSEDSSNSEVSNNNDTNTIMEGRKTKKQRRKLEKRLKSLLQQHYGSTKHQDVRHAIEELKPYNPTPQPTQSPLLVGDFICHTIPEFPGRLRVADKSVIQYTLGRLSFGIFQPHNLVCTVRSVRQSIRVRLESKTGVFKTYDYPVLMDLTIHAHGGDLPAIVSHDAVCYECPQSRYYHATSTTSNSSSNAQNRLKVTFKGSCLQPSREVLSSPDLLEIWKHTFQGAYAKAAQERNILSRTLRGMMAWWFQMTFPNDDDICHEKNYAVEFQMKRAPRGHLDIWYMSDTTRITKGNRGTLVVVEPVDGPLLEEGKLHSKVNVDLSDFELVEENDNHHDNPQTNDNQVRKDESSQQRLRQEQEPVGMETSRAQWEEAKKEEEVEIKLPVIPSSSSSSSSPSSSSSNGVDSSNESSTLPVPSASPSSASHYDQETKV